MSALQLTSAVQKALEASGFNVTQAEAGQIQTDWRDYEGELHIARRWEERSRFRISIIPDVSNPVGAARFEVAEETQRRSNSRANWEPATARPARAREVAALVDSKL